jgi:hypothetical protein
VIAGVELIIWNFGYVAAFWAWGPGYAIIEMDKHVRKIDLAIGGGVVRNWNAEDWADIGQEEQNEPNFRQRQEPCDWSKVSVTEKRQASVSYC